MAKVIDQLEITIQGSRLGGSSRAVVRYSCIDDVNSDLKSPTKSVTMNMAEFMGAAAGVITPQSASAFWFAVLHAAEYVEGLQMTPPPVRPDWAAGAELVVEGLTQTGFTLRWVSPFTASTVHSFKVLQNGQQIGTTTGDPQFTVSGLTKSTVYTFKVEASGEHDGQLYWTTDGPQRAVETAE